MLDAQPSLLTCEVVDRGSNSVLQLGSHLGGVLPEECGGEDWKQRDQQRGNSNNGLGKKEEEEEEPSNGKEEEIDDKDILDSTSPR